MRKYWQRGCLLVAVAMMVSIVTYAFDAQTHVRFGILHLIGVGILLLPFFMRLKEWNALIGILLIGIGEALHGPIILLPHNFTTIDYFPLFPWFGVILLGAALGHLLYIRSIEWRSSFSILHYQFSILSWPSRHSLLIYLIHQPILLLILKLLLEGPRRHGG
jgi:uncharacterized membrane protein